MNGNSDETTTPTRNEETEAKDIPKQGSDQDARQRTKYRNESSSSEDDNSNEAINQQKRSKGNSPLNSPVAGFMFPGYAASPPKFVSLEEIMKAANGVSNMALAHEIAVDKNFKIEKPEPKQNSLLKQVEEIVHKAFWDVLEEQLQMDPPEYKQGLNLLTQVKEDLLSLLLPQHTRLREQIDEVLDLDLIKQKAENEALDFHYYAQYVLSTMAKMCAPVRDEKIREVMVIKDVVPLFREIMQLLEVLKLDMANFTIQQIRPHIQQHSIEYEKVKFKEFLKTQIDGLELTRMWLRSAFKELRQTNDSKIEASKVMTLGYMKLLKWDRSKIYPETLILDQARFSDCGQKLGQLTVAASILLITYSTVGAKIQGVASLKQTLKQNITTLMEDVDLSTSDKLMDLLKNISLQVVKEVNECLMKHDFPELRGEDQTILRGQIEQVSSADNKIKNLVEMRCTEFIEQVLTSVTASPTKIPPGLSSFQPELANLTGQFLRLVSHNRAVFGEYYSDIVSTFNDESATL